MKIIALAGRKQSGKSTLYKTILGYSLIRLALVRDRAAVGDDGVLWISDWLGDKEYEGIFDHTRTNEGMINTLEEFVHPYVKEYSFAYHLKKTLCVDILGLKYEQVFGTDAEKNELTDYKWEDMPGVITDRGCVDLLKTAEVRGRLGHYYTKLVTNTPGGFLYYHPPGQMSGRQVMQFAGTEIFRKMNPDIWANACMNQIENEDTMFYAVITDCRFPNEVDAVHRAGGKVIRLTRNMKDTDVHESERALDPDRYDWSNFDAVIDNENMTIAEQHATLLATLGNWGWLEMGKEDIPQ